MNIQRISNKPLYDVKANRYIGSSCLKNNPNNCITFSGCGGLSPLYEKGRELVMDRSYITVHTAIGTQYDVARIYGLDNNPHVKKFISTIASASILDYLNEMEEGGFFSFIKQAKMVGDFVGIFTDRTGLSAFSALGAQAKKCRIYGTISLNTCEMLHNRNLMEADFYKKYDITPESLDKIEFEEANELIKFYQETLYPDFFSRALSGDSEPSLCKNVYPHEHIERFLVITGQEASETTKIVGEVLSRILKKAKE